MARSTKNKAFIAIFGILILTSILFLVYFPKCQTKSISDLKAKIELEDKIRQTWATIIGGGAILVGLYLNWRNIKAIEESAKQAQSTSLQTLELSQQAQVSDRFTRAVDQLGSVKEGGKANLEIRLGGLYSLERIARDNPGYRSQIMEIMTAYVRENAIWANQDHEVWMDIIGQDEIDSEAFDKNIQKPNADVQAIITILGRRSRIDEENQYIDLFNTNLQRVYVSNAQLPKANFFGSHLEHAYFLNTNLEGAYFNEAYLYRAHFNDSNLKKAHFNGSDLRHADFENIQMSLDANKKDELHNRFFQRAPEVQGGYLCTWEESLQYYLELGKWLGHFDDAKLTYANFRDAKLYGATFRRAKLNNAKLNNADLTECNFEAAHLKNADCTLAKFINAILVKADFQNADLFNTTFDGADLTEANLLGAQGLNAEQLTKAKSLKDAQLDEDVLRIVRERCPHLLKDTRLVTSGNAAH